MSTSTTPLYSRDYVLLNAANLTFSLYTTIFIFLPAYLYRLGIREGEIGVLMAIGTLVGVALKPGFGMLVGRRLRRTFLSLGSLLAAASTVPWLFVTAPGAHLYAIRIAQGASFSMVATAAYGYIAACAPVDRRAEALGIFGLSFFLPISVGGWIGEWTIARYGFHGMFAAGIGAVVLSGLIPFFMKEPESREHPSLGSLKVFLTRPFFVPNTAGYLFGMAYGSIFTFLPVYLVVRKSGSLGSFVFVYALSVIATRTLGRKLLDRLPREWVSLWSLLLLCAGNLLIPAVDGGLGLALVGAASGAGHGLLFPALSALVLDRVREDTGGMAMTMAMFTAAFDMGLVTGAAAFGFVAEHFGYPAMFVSAAAAVGLGTGGFFMLDPAFRKAGRPEPSP
ncbi:MAG: MFS transporter [Deltaproteobacteria bacterium]|nr:MAG: MFS transporter [Deltaproteobacteria bacterium]